MFRHQFEIKSNTQIKASERKLMREKFADIFSIPQDDLSELFSKKSAAQNVKIVIPDGTIIQVWVINKVPLAFTLDGQLFPTLFLLWKYPDMFPSFTTHENVTKFIKSGADLMVPGVHLPSDLANSPLARIKKGDLVYVNLNTNRAALAVGVAAQSITDMVSSGRGKCVSIMHFIGDKLCKFEGLNMNYPQLEPPSSETFELGETSLAGDAATSQTADGDSSEAGIAEPGISEENEKTELSNVDFPEETKEAQKTESPTEEMDDLAKYCFLSAVKYSKTLKLPILTSSFYKLEMLPLCPSDKKLDIKKTSFKKLKNFLDHMQNLGVIVVKETSKGVEQIISVDKEHEQVRGCYINPEDRPRTSTSTEDESNVEIVEKYMVTAAVSDIFLEQGYKKGDALVPAEIRKFITAYAKNNHLKSPENPSKVKPNTLIAKICKTQEEVSWEKVMEDVINAMKKCLEVKAGQEEIVTKGETPKITLNVVTRSGNKKVTLVDNLEPYGINLAEFSKECMHGVAASTSISKPPGKKYDQLMVQGNQVVFVQNLLIEKYKIPKKFIVSLASAPKKKKK